MLSTCRISIVFMASAQCSVKPGVSELYELYVPTMPHIVPQLNMKMLNSLGQFQCPCLPDLSETSSISDWSLLSIFCSNCMVVFDMVGFDTVSSWTLPELNGMFFSSFSSSIILCWLTIVSIYARCWCFDFILSAFITVTRLILPNILHLTDFNLLCNCPSDFNPPPLMTGGSFVKARWGSLAVTLWCVPAEAPRVNGDWSVRTGVWSVLELSPFLDLSPLPLFLRRPAWYYNNRSRPCTASSWIWRLW